jgi:hypothetical protein
MLLGLDFMTPDQISSMSLNGMRRRVATCKKIITETRMDELLVSLDMRHSVSASGGPPLSLCFPKRSLFKDLQN